MLHQVELGRDLSGAVGMPTKNQLIPLSCQIKELLGRLGEKGFSALALVPVLIADVFGAPADSDSAIAKPIEGRSPEVEVSATCFAADDEGRMFLATDAVADCVL